MSLPDLSFDERGLLPVIAQDADSGEVLTLAYANRRAVEATLASGDAHYWSRSRDELWRKGATSGHTQQVIEVRYDCDCDALLYRVRPVGPACHTGERSCFYRTVAGLISSSAEASVPNGAGGITAEGPVSSSAEGSAAGNSAPSTAEGIGEMMNLIERVIEERLHERPEGSYVVRLHDRGVGYVAQKVVEEAGESVVAALQGDDEGLVGEAADLLFHLVVLLHERGLGLERVAGELAGRHRDRTGGQK